MNNAPRLSRFAACALASGILSIALLVGCDKPASNSVKQPVAPETSPVVAETPTNAATEGPGKDEKVCFGCGGQGAGPCHAPGCVCGKVNCPAPCVKLNTGIWVKHPELNRPDPNELMQLIVIQGHKILVSSHHEGVQYFWVNGDSVMRACPVCGGAAKVNCQVCKGTTKQTCQICAGKKFIPVAWTPTDNPWFNSQPDLIRLKDGQVVLGRVALSSGDDRTIVTRDKKVIHAKASDILPKSDSTPPPATNAPPAK
jgi:hypothetical protein